MHALHQNQKQKRQQDADNISRRSLQKQEKAARFRNAAGVFAQDVGVGDDNGIIRIGGGAVGDETRLAAGVGGAAADFMGDGLAVAVRVQGAVCDDVSGLEGIRVNITCQYQVSRRKIRGGHGVRHDDQRPVAEQGPLGTVERGDGHDGEHHHK